jgi:hypothetical protein
MAAGNLAESETVLRRSLALPVESKGESNRLTQRALQLLVELYQDWRRPAQAAACAARIVPEK